MPLVMIGTGILWFGWFGFNAGSALAANGQAAQAFMNTFLAAAAAGLAWVVVEWIRDGHPTNLGAASGIVAGLVAITPAAGFVSGRRTARHRRRSPASICCYAVRLKTKAGYDDALDVVGVHFVGGLVGSLTDRLLRQPRLLRGLAVHVRGGPVLRRRPRAARRAGCSPTARHRLVVRASRSGS